jgi:hypothetical protein
MRDFLYQGFNEDEQGQRVFDGISIHIPGAHKLYLNYRFAQPNPYSVQHRDRYVPDVNWPVTYQVMPDPLGELPADGILRRCLYSGTCPKIIHTDTSTEYWQFRSALVDTDGAGNDIPLPDQVRKFLLTGTQHFPRKGATPAFGSCQQLSNVTHPGVLMRALIVALDDWATAGKQPPDSRIPTVADGTLVSSDQASTGFPEIPGVGYNGLDNHSGERNFGSQAPRGENRGIVGEIRPPVLLDHVNLVPKVNEFGIDMGGLNQPIVEHPVATLTGWNLRREDFTEGDLCDLTGMTVPLFNTEAEQLAAGDPRPSVEELYGNHRGYVNDIRTAARVLRAQRLMLTDDVHTVVQEARDSDVLR